MKEEEEVEEEEVEEEEEEGTAVVLKGIVEVDERSVVFCEEVVDVVSVDDEEEEEGTAVVVKRYS